ncbi:MAG: OpgC domain-containing protein [Proteobacteria bacterium]|nr:OpgC domain-containing protein [Pseudomonadota bacterium]
MLSEPAATRATGRDLRLDFFRGLALWFIFLDHIPSNAVNWVTIRNYGFSDAAEVFIFVSGYSAALAYVGAMRNRGFAFGAARILRRCWQIYTAHIILFTVFVAQIAYVALSFNNPLFTEEMNMIRFMNEPHVTIAQALLLKFKPVNMDVLPLYIALLLVFPAVLWALIRAPRAVLAGSILLFAATRIFALNLPSFPEGVWYFNPFAWQLLFVIGALLGLHHRSGWRVEPNPRVFVPLAFAYLAFAFAVVLTWHIPPLREFLPNWLGRLLYPIDKTNLDVLRLLHFLALAYLATLLVRPQAAFLERRPVRPLVICGQQSLAVFCVGVILSFVGYVVLVEVNGSLAVQLLVSAAGIGILILVARVLSWYKGMERAVAPPPLAAAPAVQGRSEGS